MKNITVTETVAVPENMDDVKELAAYNPQVQDAVIAAVTKVQVSNSARNMKWMIQHQITRALREARLIESLTE